jgi:hypothetical protein
MLNDREGKPMSYSNSIVASSRWLPASLLLVAVGLTPAHAQRADEGPSSPSDRQVAVVGRVEFDYANAPAATVEVDVSHGMLSDIAGIGQAALNGVAEALSESSTGQGDGPVRQSAEHLQAANQIIASLTGVVHEVRVRVYDDLADEDQGMREAMVSHYQQKLQGTEWESIVRVHDDDAKVNVSALRHDGAIRGLFVIISEDGSLVMANLVCELTPDKVQQVTTQATKIGMKVGLEQAIHDAMRGLRQAQR